MALSLMAILITFLFSYFGQIKILEKKIDVAREEILSRQDLQVRLNQIFSQIIPSHVLNKSSIYTVIFPKENQPSLVFNFNHGIDPDPAFSGPTLGRIYIDENNNLCLLIWPLDNEKKDSYVYRKEILLQNVKNFQFELLGKKDPKFVDPNSHQVNDFLEWVTIWSKERRDLPTMIKMNLTQNLFEEEEKVAFAFFLSTVDPVITYFEKK